MRLNDSAWPACMTHVINSDVNPKLQGRPCKRGMSLLYSLSDAKPNTAEAICKQKSDEQILLSAYLQLRQVCFALLCIHLLQFRLLLIQQGPFTVCTLAVCQQGQLVGMRHVMLMWLLWSERPQCDNFSLDRLQSMA